MRGLLNDLMLHIKPQNTAQQHDGALILAAASMERKTIPLSENTDSNTYCRIPFTRHAKKGQK